MILRVLCGVLFLLSLGLGFSGCSPKGMEPDVPILEMTFLDVGQGDAAFIRFPDQTTLLIDTGPENVSLATMEPFQDLKRIDHLVITHPHLDHYGGLRSLLARFPVSHVYLSRFYAQGAEPVFSALVRWMTDTLKVDTVLLSQGRPLFSRSSYSARCLWPDTLPHKTEDPINEGSLVIRIDAGKASLLLTGDIGFASEKELLAENILSSCTVLKVGHHGSASATAAAFLAALSPEIAVISCGHDNPFGHPAQETVTRVENAGITLFRTDQNGSVRMWITEEGEIRTNSSLR